MAKYKKTKFYKSTLFLSFLGVLIVFGIFFVLSYKKTTVIVDYENGTSSTYKEKSSLTSNRLVAAPGGRGGGGNNPDDGGGAYDLHVILVDSTLMGNGETYLFDFGIDWLEQVMVHDLDGFSAFYDHYGKDFNITFERVELNAIPAQLVADIADQVDPLASIPNGADYIMYVVPPYYGYSGTSQLNGQRSVVAILNSSFRNNFRMAAIHEIGHNLGMAHATSSHTGTHNEYGDKTDVMSSANFFLFNAPHTSLMGWMPNAAKITTNSGTYTLSPVDLKQGLQMIRLKNTNYYLSTRKNVGPFNTMHLNAPSLYADNTLYIHEAFTIKGGQWNGGKSTKLWHIVPVGSSVVVGNKTITNVSADGDNIVVNIE